MNFRIPERWTCYLLVCLCLCVALFVTGAHARTLETPDKSWLDKLQTRLKQSWVLRAYREYRIYPRMNRFYDLLKFKQYAKALELLQEVLEIEPDNLKTYHTAFALCLRIRNQNQCLEQLSKKMHANFPGTAVPDYYYAVYYDSVEKNQALAEKYAKKAMYNSQLDEPYIHYMHRILLQGSIKRKDRQTLTRQMEETIQYLAQEKGWKRGQPLPLNDTEIRYLKAIIKQLVEMDIFARDIARAKQGYQLYLDLFGAVEEATRLYWAHNLADIKAWDLAERLTRAFPVSSQMALFRLNLLEHLGRYQEGIDLMDQWLASIADREVIESHPFYWGKRLNILIKNGNLRQALRESRIALKKVDHNNSDYPMLLKLHNDLRKRTSPAYRHRLALDHLFVLQKQQRCQAIRHQAYALLAQKPQPTIRFQTWIILAQCYNRLQKPGLAIYFYEQALKHNPADMTQDLKKELALLYIAVQKPLQALHFMQQHEVSLDDQQSGVLYAKLGYRYQRQRNNAAAEQAFLKSLRFNPEQDNLYNTLAYIALRNNEPAEALEFFEHALFYQPRQPAHIFEDLAYTYIRQDQNDKAVSAFQQAIDQYRALPGINKAQRQQQYRDQIAVRNLKQQWFFSFTEVVRFDPANFYPDTDARLHILPYSSYTGFASVNLSYHPKITHSHQWGKLFINARSFWSNRNQSLEPIYDLRQAGLGVSYQPLVDQPFYMGIEHLFAVGKSVPRDDNLLRLSYGTAEGLYWQPEKKQWWVHNLYLDTAYLLRDETLYATATLDFGKAYPFRGTNTPMAWLPYVSLGASDNGNETRIDAGIGIQLLSWFSPDRYQSHRVQTRFSIEARGKIGGNTHDTTTIRGKFEILF